MKNSNQRNKVGSKKQKKLRSLFRSRVLAKFLNENKDDSPEVHASNEEILYPELIEDMVASAASN